MATTSAMASQVGRIQQTVPQKQTQVQPTKPAAQSAYRDTISLSTEARALALNLEGMTVQQIAQYLQIDLQTVTAYLSVHKQAGA